VLAFLEAHNGIVQLLDAVARALQTIRKEEWERWRKSWPERYREYLDVLHRHRFDVTTFLVVHGKEEPQAAHQAVACLIGACVQARQDIDRTPWANLDLAGIRDAVGATAEPVLQALRLRLHEMESLISPGTGPAGGKGGRPKEGQPSVNARLIDLITQKPECKGWGSRKVAEALGCAKSSVEACSAFKQLEGVRRIAQAERRERDARKQGKTGTGRL
jgi:hypothetical protein